jgi:uncharacterized membrane protein
MMAFWILVFSYWFHLLATVIWLGGLALMLLVAWPALRRGTLADNHWLVLQQRFMPWASGSLIVLLITGFVQMTNDANYTGFLQIDSLWAGAILIKHLAFGGMVAIGIYVQWVLYPAMERLKLLGEKRPSRQAHDKASLHLSEQTAFSQREIRLLRLNLLCAAAVLFCTAVATAV